jgi:hypothetical protein
MQLTRQPVVLFTYGLTVYRVSGELESEDQGLALPMRVGTANAAQRVR